MSGKQGDGGRGSAERPADPGRRRTLKQLAALGLLAMADAGGLSSCGRRRAVLPLSRREREKVIVVGLDGLDPRLIERLMGQGKLPNMTRLMEMGGFRRLTTSVPPQSPVAWATFITGRDPGGHGIFDFIQRDPKTYLPYLSIARTEPPSRTLSLGDWRIPVSGGTVELLRAGPAFWDVLAEHGVPAVVYRAPTNFPPRDTGARQLAGLGAPDLRGSYGEFSFYTDEPQAPGRQVTGGSVYPVALVDGRARARLRGPENTLRAGSADTSVPLDIAVDGARGLARITAGGEQVLLRTGEWSDWIAVKFELIPRLKWVSGICRLYLKAVSPHLKLYVTPVNVDPRDPALPIAAPAGFARDLARRFGPFYTQGFPHDVKALRQGVLDDGEYLQQSEIAFGEERRMYEAALHEFDRGLLFYYFATTDRTQHMFWRTMDPRHPAHDPRLARDYGGVVEECYLASDRIVGQALEGCDAGTTLVVMSDHGFNPYYRSFNLNTWLASQRYLVGVAPWGDGADIFGNADWQSTLAYGLGFNSLYLNLAGREPRGTVGPAERELLAEQLADELLQVRDPETGDRVIERVYRGEQVYSPDQADRAPDLIVGYARGYRCCDESVLGKVTEAMTAENTDRWSGDHCVDRSLVPGMVLTNRPIAAEAPDLTDITATALAELGAPKPEEMRGEPIW